MIISKTNLQCVLLTHHDKIPVLANVVIEPDGTTVASNGKAMMVVSPVHEKMVKSFPLKSEAKSERIIFNDDTAKEILKSLPKDSKFGGLLEHVIVETDPMNEDQAKFQSTDGKRTKTMSGKKWDRRYIDYRAVLSKSYQSKKKVKVAVNLKRLLSLVEALDKACPDSTGTSPIFLEFSEDDDIMLRGVNQSNGQRVTAVMKSYKGNEGQWLELNDWEENLYGTNDIRNDNSSSNDNLGGSSGNRGDTGVQKRGKVSKIPKKTKNL